MISRLRGVPRRYLYLVIWAVSIVSYVASGRDTGWGINVTIWGALAGWEWGGHLGNKTKYWLRRRRWRASAAMLEMFFPSGPTVLWGGYGKYVQVGSIEDLRRCAVRDAFSKFTGEHLRIVSGYRDDFDWRPMHAPGSYHGPRP